MVKKAIVSYDKEADVMYVSFGRPKNAEAIEIKSGIWARVSQKNKSLVGFTIINFSKKFGISAKEIEVRVPT